MIPYVVRRGDHLPKLAARMHFDADAIWNDSANDALRALRPDMHMLCAGDILYVPESPPGNWFPATLGAVNRFVCRRPLVPIHVTFAQMGKPIANASCTVHGLAPPNQLVTDANGVLRFEAPATLDHVTVEFASPRLLRRLHIGDLDPIEEPSGVYHRLRNLGIRAVGPMPLEFDPDAMSRALKAFQAAQGIPVTGEVDDETSKRLKAAHGC